MTKWLRELNALAEDPSLVLSKYVIAHKQLRLWIQGVQILSLVSEDIWHTHIVHILCKNFQNAYTYKKSLNEVTL